jgi:transcriptional regulator with XRE-family HTH domain
MIKLRDVLGGVLRAHREEQHRTLRDVSRSASVSLGYLSEIERGQKEPSSEMLAAICGALDVELADLLSEASVAVRRSRPVALEVA